MTTRSKIEFEQSLIDALKKKNVIETISNLIINNVVSELTEKFKTYDDKIAQLEAEIIDLKSKNKDFIGIETEESKQKRVEQKLDSVQQHIKNNNIRLMNVPEAEDEDLQERIYDIFKNTMNVALEKSDLMSVFRVGRRNANKARHVLVTLKDNSKKMIVYNSKKKLKGSKIIMKEDLTVNRLNIIKIASDKYGFKNVWTINGIIFARTDKGVEKLV